MVELEVFRQSDIPAMIDDPRLWDQEFLATTRHRLFVHQHNPAMRKDDVVLIVAWYEGIMIGYIGGFADFVHTANGYEKITWLHSWWMNPEYRFTKAGLMLFEKVYEACNGRIGISQFTPSAGRIYYKSGKFNALTVLKGYKFIIRLELAHFLQTSQNRWMKALIPFGWLTDVGTNAVAFVFRKVKIFTTPCPRAEFLAQIDTATEQFIRKHQPVPVCNRGKSFFDFLYHYNVILQTITPSVNDDRYFFSHRAVRFGFFYIKLKDKEGNITAFLVLQVRDRILKLLYAFYEPEVVTDCANIIAHHADRLKSRTFLLYDEGIGEAFKSKRALYFIMRKKEKEVLISKEFLPSESWKESVFHYGDGDCCFA